MTRAPFQVLVFPYRRDAIDGVAYAPFRRSDLGLWQGLAGGGENQETPEVAARRELAEEAGIATAQPLVAIQTTAEIPVEHFTDRQSWPLSLSTIPEYAFAVDIGLAPIRLSPEHDPVRWELATTAIALLEWESNRAALRELDQRLTFDRHATPD